MLTTYPRSTLTLRRIVLSVNVAVVSLGFCTAAFSQTMSPHCPKRTRAIRRRLLRLELPQLRMPFDAPLKRAADGMAAPLAARRDTGGLAAGLSFPASLWKPCWGQPWIV